MEFRARSIDGHRGPLGIGMPPSRNSAHFLIPLVLAVLVLAHRRCRRWRRGRRWRRQGEGRGGGARAPGGHQGGRGPAKREAPQDGGGAGKDAPGHPRQGKLHSEPASKYAHKTVTHNYAQSRNGHVHKKRRTCRPNCTTLKCGAVCFARTRQSERRRRRRRSDRERRHDHTPPPVTYPVASRHMARATGRPAFHVRVRSCIWIGACFHRGDSPCALGAAIWGGGAYGLTK